MRRILNIALCVSLLCSCADSLDDPFTMAGVGSLLRPAQNFPLGADAVLSYSGGGISFEDPMAHYWDFEPDDADDDYLRRGNVDELEADSYTIVVAVMPEDWTAAFYPTAMYNNNNRAWRVQVSNAKIQSDSSGANACNDSESQNVTDAGWNAGVVALVAMTFDYSGNAGVADSTQTVYIVRAGSTLSSADAGTVGPVLDCNADVTIATLVGSEALSVDGRIYWWAYYDFVLTQNDLEDLLDGTLHPAMDFTVVAYVDFSKAVAATYAPEVGAAWVFNVFGSPVQGP